MHQHLTPAATLFAMQRNRGTTTPEEGSETAADDGFNGWGPRLLELAEEYEGYKRQFDADGRELLDQEAGLVGDDWGPWFLVPPRVRHVYRIYARDHVGHHNSCT